MYPGFDLHWLRRMVRLEVGRLAEDGASVDVVVDFTHLHSNGTLLRMSFRGTRQCVLPTLEPTFFVSEVELEDVSAAQLEGIRVHVRDHGSSGFQVWCREVRVDLVPAPDGAVPT